MAEESLSIIGHGRAGSGKTTLGLTGPTPTLFLDVETASRFIPKRDKIEWDPMKDAPPVYDGTWKFCVVKVTNWSIATKVMEYLRSDKHVFKTVVIDSISEILVKAKENIRPSAGFRIQDWGTLSQNLGGMLRELRDITARSSSSIEVLYLISTSKDTQINVGTKDKEDFITYYRPHLEGSIQSQAPYLFDMVVFIDLASSQDPANPFNTIKEQTIYTETTPFFLAKSRPPGVPAALKNFTLERLLSAVYSDIDRVEEEYIDQVTEIQDPVQGVDKPEVLPDNSVEEKKTSSSKTKVSALPDLPK